VLFIAILSNLPPAREVWPWLITYTTNIYITLNDAWVGRLGHFWTLAVEEQFYLIWPWLVLFAPRKWLVPVMLIVIPLAPAYRYYAYKNFPFDIGAMDFKAGTFTVASLDSLGMGALLALLWRSNIQKVTLQKYLSRVILPAGVFMYIFVLVLYHYRIRPGIFFTLSDLASGMIFCWLVSSAGLGFKGIPGNILEFKPLIYLGKITYGIYVYHNLTPLFLIFIFKQIGIPYQVPSFLNYVLSTVLTIVLASLSWHLFELPINNLKRYFQYTSKPAASPIRPELLESEG
jgi:peptidoglycan/LPS O-acetylase OafA/YrhL